jgi:hypothetical protein
MVQHKAVLSFTETLKREGLAVALREKYELAYNPDADSFSNPSEPGSVDSTGPLRASLRLI